MKSATDLGITPEMVNVEPLTGVSGETVFFASINFGMLPILDQVMGTSTSGLTWKFAVRIGD